MPKYGNNKVSRYGKIWDSKAELDYYEYLLIQQMNGLVRDIEIQPKIELIPKFYVEGELIRAVTYTPDFKVTYSDGQVEYIDVKGFSTQQGEVRRKLFMYKTGYTLRWLAANKKHCKDGSGFVDYFELKKIRRSAKKEVAEKK